MAKIITERILRYEIPDGKKKERVDLYLTNSVENASRTRIQKFIDAGCVTVNGKAVKSNHKIMPGDTVELKISVSPRPEKAEPEDIPLDIVYEDEYLIVLNKPPGIVVHPSFGNFTGTLVNALLHHTGKLSDFNDPQIRPGIVHRIDKDTSGLLLVAKDNWVHAQLAKQFASHTIQREYNAIVWGIPKVSEGEINSYITRSKKDRKIFTMSVDEGKFASTSYKIIEKFEFASLLSLKLKTGRTHQIRVHLSGTGHPIFGDETYGGTAIRYGSQLPKIKSRIENLLQLMPRQALHAKTIGFVHPIKNEFMSFDSDLYSDMQNLLKSLRINTILRHD